LLEGDESTAQVTARGYERETVERVARLVRISEYKRRQAAPGPKISTRAFNRERRYPIVNGYRG
ncbi:MAG: NAD+ synthase, partial [Pseudomonadota bacterium]